MTGTERPETTGLFTLKDYEEAARVCFDQGSWDFIAGPGSSAPAPTAPPWHATCALRASRWQR